MTAPNPLPRVGPSGPLSGASSGQLIKQDLDLLSANLAADASISVSPRVSLRVAGAGLTGGGQLVAPVPDVADQFEVELADIEIQLGTVDGTPPAGVPNLAVNPFIGNVDGQTGTPGQLQPVPGGSLGINFAAGGAGGGALRTYSFVNDLGATLMPAAIPGGAFVTISISLTTDVYPADIWIWGVRAVWRVKSKV